MNKKYIIAGVLFWAAVSGYMGIRCLNSYTEDAVSASLACIPAKARDIRFSILEKTLEIEGLEYEIPDDKVQRKGAIEHVMVKGFNRKILFVLPTMPEYDPEQLPLVAEHIVATGITETRHESYLKETSSLSSLEIHGWRQRLGLLFDRYARGGTDARFFEELFRCGMEGAQADGLRIAIEDSRDKKTRQLLLDRVALPDGIVPPGREEYCRPLHILAEKAGGTGDGGTFSLERIDLSGFMPPAPAMLARIRSLSWEDFWSAYAAGEPHRHPAFTRLDLGAFSAQDNGSGHSVTFGSLSCAIKTADNGAGMDLSLQKLQLPGSLLPEAGDIFRRYAPDGIKADIRVKGNASGNEYSSSFQFLLHGLGKLDAAAACSGDLQAVLASALSKHAGADFMKLLTKVRMKQASLAYEDSGCAALALEVAAKNAGMPPLAFRDALDARLGKVLEDEAVSGVLADASRIFREQLYAPGKVSAALAQGKSLTMAQFALAALMQPAKLPVTLSSEAGQRRMEEYFQ